MVGVGVPVERQAELGEVLRRSAPLQRAGEPDAEDAGDGAANEVAAGDA